MTKKPKDVDQARVDAERDYWQTELRIKGMTFEQADKLVNTPGVNFHDVITTLERGCPPELAFDIYS